MNAEDLKMIVAMIGGFVGLAGWFSTRDKAVRHDAQWKGRIEAKLDALLVMQQKIGSLEEQMRQCGETLAVHEHELHVIKEERREQRIIS